MCLLQGLLSVKVFFPLFSLAVSFVADIMLVLIAAFGQRALLFLIADNLSESCESHNILSLIIQPAHTTWSGELQNTVLEFGVLFEARAKSLFIFCDALKEDVIGIMENTILINSMGPVSSPPCSRPLRWNLLVSRPPGFMELPLLVVPSLWGY